MICRRRANYKLNLLPRPLQIVQKLNFRKIRSVTIYDKVRVVSNRVWFYDICTNTFKKIPQICYKLIAGATISGGETCGCVFAIVPAITMTNRYGGKIQNSIKKTFKVVRTLLSGLHSCPLILLKYGRQSFNRNTLRAEIVTLSKCLERKNMRFAIRKRWMLSWILQFELKSNLFKWRWHWFLSDVEQWRNSQTRVCLRRGSHKLSHEKHRRDWIQYNRWHESFSAALPCFCSKTKGWENCRDWKKPELSNYQIFRNL